MCDCKSEDRNFENEEILVIPDDDDLGYCQRCGGKFNNKVICEVCGDTEEWAWDTPRNKNKTECANCGNEIYEVRRYCFFAEQKTNLLFKKAINTAQNAETPLKTEFVPTAEELLNFSKNANLLRRI